MSPLYISGTFNVAEIVNRTNPGLPVFVQLPGAVGQVQNAHISQPTPPATSLPQSGDDILQVEVIPANTSSSMDFYFHIPLENGK